MVCLGEGEGQAGSRIVAVVLALVALFQRCIRDEACDQADEQVDEHCVEESETEPAASQRPSASNVGLRLWDKRPDGSIRVGSGQEYHVPS